MKSMAYSKYSWFPCPYWLYQQFSTASRYEFGLGLFSCCMVTGGRGSIELMGNPTPPTEAPWRNTGQHVSSCPSYKTNMKQYHLVFRGISNTKHQLTKAITSITNSTLCAFQEHDFPRRNVRSHIKKPDWISSIESLLNSRLFWSSVLWRSNLWLNPFWISPSWASNQPKHIVLLLPQQQQEGHLNADFFFFFLL